MDHAPAPGAALLYSAPPSGVPLFGLSVAVDALHGAYLRHARQPRLVCHGRDEADFAAFRARATAEGADAARLAFVPRAAPAGLAASGALLVPDPAIADAVRARDAVDPRGWSVVGLTHSMTGPAVVQAVAAARAGQPWDAIVCPSRAIRAAIAALWAGLGAAPCPVRLPVIPLGVAAERFAAAAAPSLRAAQRARLGIPEDGVAVLFHGRLSHWGKAHPLPLLLAAERAASEQGAPPVHLVFSGYFPSPGEDRAFRGLAADICTAVRVHVVDNGDPDFPRGCWAAADVFASPVDNVQESFGLTPVEAMAAGLPVLASDWDGYRDTVRHGREGLLVPTVTPPPGDGADLAARLAAGEDAYGEHLAAVAQSVAVDVEAMAAHLALLVRDAGLRRRLGEAGRQRVAEFYDWPRVIAAYEALFTELAGIRATAPLSPAGTPQPAPYPDPYAMFAAFPSRALAAADRLHAAPDAVAGLAKLLRHPVCMAAPWALLPPATLAPLIGRIATAPGLSVAALADGIAIDPAGPQGTALRRTLAWLAKLGALRIAQGYL
ncbi:MAG: glycosyltransferase family 4 protein [Alphaproteobacteria bacterium]